MSHLQAVTDARGQTTSFEYDVNGRLKKTTSPDGLSETLTYYPGGRLQARLDRNAVTTTYTYDPAGRLYQKTYSDSTPTVTLGYDDAWRVSSLVNDTDTVTRTYDLAGQLRSELSSKNGSTVGYDYDEAGNRKELDLAGTALVTYHYDDDGKLDILHRGGSDFLFGFDNAHRRTGLTYPLPNGVVTTYGYDNRSQLTSLGASQGATVLTQFGYGYDLAGNRTSKAAVDYSETYGYDTLYRLTDITRTGIAGVWHEAYDKVGNRTSDQNNTQVVQASHNNRNQLTGTVTGGSMRWRGTLSEPGSVTLTDVSVNGQPAKMLAGNTFEATIPMSPGTSDVTVTATDVSGNARTNVYRVNVTGTPTSWVYDNNGNLTSRSDGTNNWVYGWDAENRLVRACLNLSSCSGTNATATFRYDAGGRRVEKAAGETTTTYLYDGSDILQQTTGGVLTRYIHGPGMGPRDGALLLQSTLLRPEDREIPE